MKHTKDNPHIVTYKGKTLKLWDEDDRLYMLHDCDDGRRVFESICLKTWFPDIPRHRVMAKGASVMFYRWMAWLSPSTPIADLFEYEDKVKENYGTTNQSNLS